MFVRHKRLPSRGLGVCDDWIRALPREKNHVFNAAVERWERSYAMMSVALDDAFSLRACGELICAREEVGVSAELLRPLGDTLIGFCEIAARRGRRVPIENIPSVEPMRSEFFRGDIAQSAASWNNVLHHVLAGARSRFVHKVRILSVTISQLKQQFLQTVEELARGSSISPSDSWKLLDDLHYDLNTCLREAEVVLKSFLRTFPAAELETFAAELEAPLARKAGRDLMGAVSRPASV